MDILVRVEEVIKQRGMSKSEVAEKMGKAKQNFKSLLTNPKWEAIELTCAAMGIAPWELFIDDIEAAGYRKVAQEENKPTLDIDKVNGNNSHKDMTTDRELESSGQEGEESAFSKNASPEAHNQNAADDLPFNESEAEQVQAVRFSYQCPRCGERMNVCISQGKKKS